MDKREIELTHGKALLTLLGIDAILEPGIEPAPDLLFTLLGKTIGLEHTRLFGDDGSSRSSFQAHEAIISEIAERARAEYVKRDLPPVEVKLFITRHVIPKARVHSLTEWIVNTVENSLPECPGTAELRNDWTKNFPEEVELIRMIRFNGQTYSFFFCTEKRMDSDNRPTVASAQDRRKNKAASEISHGLQSRLVIIGRRTKGTCEYSRISRYALVRIRQPPWI